MHAYNVFYTRYLKKSNIFFREVTFLQFCYILKIYFTIGCFYDMMVIIQKSFIFKIFNMETKGVHHV